MRHRTPFSRTTAIAAVSLALIGCSNSSGPATPAAVDVTPAAVTFGAVGSTQQLTAVVKDANGATINGAKVSWSTNNAAVATVSSTGAATAVGSGTTQIDATASGSAVKGSVTVSVAQVPAHLVKYSGDNQTGTVGQQLPGATVIQVTDSTNHPVGNVGIGFTVTAGGGNVTATSTTTGAGGLASTTWHLGTVTGVNQMTADAGTGTTTPVVFSATAVAGKPKTVQVQSGNAQTGPAGTALPNPVVVLVRDTFSNAVPGAVVQYAVTNGGGRVSQPTVTTDASGQGPMTWTLGSPGTNNLTATVVGSGITGNPVSFSATATANGTAKSVIVASGDGQTGLAGYALNVQPSVVVGDSLGHPVAGAEVTFAVSSGGGSVTQGVDTTDVFGVATVGSWSVTAGANGLSATVTGSGITGNPAGFTATGVNKGFKIDIRFLSTMTSADSAAFLAAKTKWETAIYQPVAGAHVVAGAGSCGSNSPALDTTNVTSVIIFASVVPIDGPGKILAEAGPCLIRSTGFLPALGIMEFDSADVPGLGASLSDVILHEMGHVLGYGTIWDASLANLIRNPCGTSNPCTSDPYLVGTQATSAFFKVGGAIYTGGAIIPVENTGGQGTADGHWRETVFKAELLTGYYNSGMTNPLSLVSIAAMGDLGYTVNYAAADNYVLSWPLLATAVTQVHLENDILRIPITVIDADGRPMRVVAPH